MTKLERDIQREAQMAPSLSAVTLAREEYRELLAVAEAARKYMETIGYGEGCPCLSCRRTLPLRAALAPLLEKVKEGPGIASRLVMEGGRQGSGMTWRVGTKVPLNVYEGDRPICQCHNAEDAQRIVQALAKADGKEPRV